MQHKQILIVGLGKMGGGIALQLKDKGYEVYGYNRTESVTKEFEQQGITGIYSYSEIKEKMQGPRVVWVMVPAGDAVDQTLQELAEYLESGDYLIDAGNSFYKHTQKRYEHIQKKDIHFVDVGVSGGPSGARNGACIMIGGTKEKFDYLEPIFRDTTVEKGYEFFEGDGAGHFVKMIHNGIEYGMMQAIGEGFGIMRSSDFELDLKRIASVYNHGSVIESSLIGWLHDGFEKYGVNLDSISGTIKHSGEGQWTAEAAEEMGIEVPIIKGSFQYRLDSEKSPSYIGKIVSVLRNMFGGHEVSK